MFGIRWKVVFCGRVIVACSALCISARAEGAPPSPDPLTIAIEVQNEAHLAILISLGVSEARLGRFFHEHGDSSLLAILDALGVRYEVLRAPDPGDKGTRSVFSVPPPDGQWTVISHGAFGNVLEGSVCFPINTPFDPWMTDLAQRINNLDPNAVVVHTMNRDTFSISPQAPFDNSKHHVLLWDWSCTSFILIDKDGKIGPDGYAYAAGDALFAFLKHHGIADKAKYFIGHSRGAVVISEATRRLILDGHDPTQVIYLDGEGGNCFQIGYQDDRFDAWAPCNPANDIRYDAIYSTVNEVLCYFGCNFGGPPSAGAASRLWDYNLGTRYRHGRCSLGGIQQPPIWEYLRFNMTFDGERYRWPDPSDDTSVSPPLNPNSWDSPGQDNPLFNGDFEWVTDAGWRNHGGGGHGNVDCLLGAGCYLQLFQFNQTREHSWFWLSDRFDRFRFNWRVIVSGFPFCNDELKVSLIRHDGLTKQVFSTNRCPQDLSWNTETKNLDGELAAFRGTLCKVRFEKTGGIITAISQVNGPPVDSFLGCIELPRTPQNAKANPPAICIGVCTTLTASVPGAVIDWYTGSCGGSPVGTGPSIVVCPAGTTTYFARARSGGCSSACCQEVTVVVAPLPATPSNAKANPRKICIGGCTTLTASVPGAVIDWYDGVCGQGFIGTGNSIVVCPSSSIVYRCRARDPSTGCTSTGCDFVIVEVEPDPSITISADPSVICADSSTTLAAQISGGVNCSLFQWEKSQNGCDGPWMEIRGARSSSYNTGMLSETTWYRCLLTCTGEGCDEATSNCEQVAVLDCDDGDLCTTDVCQLNRCVQTPINCDDLNPCTVDSCDSAVGCINTSVDMNGDGKVNSIDLTLFLVCFGQQDIDCKHPCDFNGDGICNSIDLTLLLDAFGTQCP